MNDLVAIINHPGVPWAGGGVIGGVIGTFALKAECTTTVITDTGFACEPGRLPLVGVVAGSPEAIALCTVLGGVIGYLVKKFG